MSENIEFFYHMLKNSDQNASLEIIVNQLDILLNKIIKAKFVNSLEYNRDISKAIYFESSSFNKKIEVCYNLHGIGMDIRAICTEIELIKNEFDSFGSVNIKHRIEEVVRLSPSELFDIIFKKANDEKNLQRKCKSLDDLIPTIGYRHTLEFIFTVIAAALIENFLML